MTVATGQRTRQARRVLDEEVRPADPVDEQPEEISSHADRMKTFTGLNFSRMRFDWRPDEEAVMTEIHARADEIIADLFASALHIRDQLYMQVRKPQANRETGEVLTRPDGSPHWEVDEFGEPVEDWLRLTDWDRDLALHKITIRLYEWEQAAARLWTDAMFAKGVFEEAFSGAYLNSQRTTVDDRHQTGQKSTMQDRYFALFRAAISRRADAVVRSMKDLLKLLDRDAKH